MSDISITVQNFSSVALADIQVFYPTIKNGPITNITTPSEGNDLKAFGGVDTLAWSSTGSWFTIGDTATAVVYKNPKTGAVFGFQIRTYVQVLGIGAAPEWWTSYEKNDSQWHKVVDEPSKTWEIPDAWAKESGLDIRVESISGHQSLKLLVIISDYKAGFNRKDLVDIKTV